MTCRLFCLFMIFRFELNQRYNSFTVCYNCFPHFPSYILNFHSAIFALTNKYFISNQLDSLLVKFLVKVIPFDTFS